MSGVKVATGLFFVGVHVFCIAFVLGLYFGGRLINPAILVVQVLLAVWGISSVYMRLTRVEDKP